MNRDILNPCDPKNVISRCKSTFFYIKTRDSIKLFRKYLRITTRTHIFAADKQK